MQQLPQMFRFRLFSTRKAAVAQAAVAPTQPAVAPAQAPFASMEQCFTNVYETNLWGNNDAAEYSGSSGDGSSTKFNENSYVPFLKNFRKI